MGYRPKVSIAGLLGIGGGACLALGCAGASAVVAVKRPPIANPETVQILFAPPKEKYTVIGTINSEGWTGMTKQARMDRAIAALKERAAKIGANAVIIEGQGTQAGAAVASTVATGGGTFMTVGGPTSKEVVQGTAIFIEAQ